MKWQENNNFNTKELMHTKLTIVEQYKKYLNAISKDNGSSIPSLFKKFYDFLGKEHNEGLDFDFYFHILRNSIKCAIKQIENKKVYLKKLSADWDDSSVKQCYKLINLLEQNAKNDDGDSYLVNFNRLSNLLFLETEDPCTMLFMCTCFSRTEEGNTFFNCRSYEVSQLIKASSEEEIEEILEDINQKLEGNKKPSPSLRFSCQMDLPREELFKLFTPTSMEEQEEMYGKLEEMATNGEISYNDYSYVKEILLNKCKHYFETKDFSTHQGNVTEPFTLQVYDGEKMLQELEEEEAEAAITE